MMMDLENKILYVDMDKVVVKWENAPFKKVSTEGFFSFRELVKTMLEAVHLVCERGVEVHILSAVLENSYAKDEKKEWLRIWLLWILESNWHLNTGLSVMIREEHGMITEYTIHRHQMRL